MDNQPTPAGQDPTSQPSISDQNTTTQPQMNEVMTPAETPAVTPESPTPAPEAPATPQTFQPSTQPMQPTDPAAPAQPMGGMQQPMVNPAATTATAHDPGQGLGIASLITSILGFGLFGVILGFIAISKSKKAGHKGNTLGLIGVILGFLGMIAFTLIFVSGFISGFSSTSSSIANDKALATHANSLFSKLEEYYNEKNSYPKTLELSKFPGMEGSALLDVSGNPIQIRAVDTAKDAQDSETPTKDAPYIYAPYGCVADACKGFVMKYYVGTPTSDNPNPTVKLGLNNL